MGFLYVASGPMVRSSYRAGEFYLTNVLRSKQEAAQGQQERGQQQHGQQQLELEPLQAVAVGVA